MNHTIDEALIERIENAAREGAKEGAKEATKGIRRVGLGITGGILKKVIFLVIIVAVLGVAITKFNPFPNLREQFSREKAAEEHDIVFEDDGFFGYKAADFAEVILGDSDKLKKLEVFSQDMSQMVELKKAGLAKIKLFSKSKFYTYHGTAIYTVNLAKLDKDSIEVDEETKTVILKIPHPEANVSVLADKIEIGDTQKGVLAIGNLNATDEERKQLSVEAKKHMEEKIKKENVQETADRMAKLSVWEVYQPMIKSMGGGYTLEVEVVE